MKVLKRGTPTNAEWYTERPSICNACGTLVQLESAADLTLRSPMQARWTCPVCGISNTEKNWAPGEMARAYYEK